MPRPKRDATDKLHISPLEEDMLLIFFGNEELYSVEIEQALHKFTGRKRHYGALQPILRDLEKRGFLSARWGTEEIPGRVGPPRRYYKITAEGKDALTAVEKRRQEYREWILAPEGG